MDKAGLRSAIGCGILLVITVFMWGCTPSRESVGNPESLVKGGSMNFEKHTENYSSVIPALDAGAPAVFETASFGLG